MPVLSNPRHERFAQELAKGKSAIEAHGLSGYSPDRGTASKLQHNPSISQRVAEIQAEGAEVAKEATQRAAEALAIDREWVLSRLQENAIKAAESGDYGPSNRALELIGKEVAGMFVDRKHVNLSGSLSDLTPEQLAAILAEDDGEDGAGEAGRPPVAH